MPEFDGSWAEPRHQTSATALQARHERVMKRWHASQSRNRATGPGSLRRLQTTFTSRGPRYLAGRAATRRPGAPGEERVRRSRGGQASTGAAGPQCPTGVRSTFPASTPTIAATTQDLRFDITTTPFTTDYSPSTTSRATTNFANLARGEHARENLSNALEMINHRFNDLIHWDNPTQDRYRVELEIVSIDLKPTEDHQISFPLMEILDVGILDTLTGARIKGIPGNNFSSYIRDYDFSVLLPTHTAAQEGVPTDFGDLHGKIFQHFLESEAYTQRFSTAPVVCISVSTSRTYRQLPNEHPVLGVEYIQDDYSLTDEYFQKMGLQVRYFKPRGAAAPLAFYFRGDLLNDHSDLALAGTIATMESFQRIYRPEIYNANSSAAQVYRPSLTSSDFSVPPVSYDREERSQLAVKQGNLAQEQLIRPYGDLLAGWAAQWADQRDQY